MTKNERATLEANFKLNWRRAVLLQETAKDPDNQHIENKAREMAARARGYREACIDVLGYSFHDGEIGAAREIQQWIDDAEQQAGAKLK
mgnify:CR=1 FL=1